ncbi:uncharacterized protein E0L32_006771 [Thyridium curvatum]|uniref:Uncharacterized protein n=1 Tax=Thyridium curvatum TaxID=1093900 RepID=A0A507B754_9PEZI|nr:uncharacterized protein E0L32_006771 [Thyridium curvatum]TPX12891.1 hypothetical protein E0L32_006771 [Thyridium curvatum]
MPGSDIAKSKQEYRAFLDAFYEEHKGHPSISIDLPKGITKCVHHDKDRRFALLAHLPAKDATATNLKPNLADATYKEALTWLSEAFPPDSYGSFTQLCIIDGIQWRFVHVPEDCCEQADIPCVAALWRTLAIVPLEYRVIEMHYRAKETLEPLEK